MKKTFLKWHKGAKLEVMDCGHCPMPEMPVQMQTIMERFMKKHAG